MSADKGKTYIYEYPPEDYPTMRIRPGEVVTSISRDPRFEKEYQRQRPPRLDPKDFDGMVGRYFVEGAEPGMTLAVEIKDIECADMGTAGGNIRWDFDLTQGYVELAEFDPPVRRKLDPMIGTIGVAPADADTPWINPPGRHGGNMDATDVTAGSTVYLPVSEPGALLHICDTHALQGDGEVLGTGIECRSWVTFAPRLLDEGLSRIVYVDRKDGMVSFLAYADSLGQAIHLAYQECIGVIMKVRGCDEETARLYVGIMGGLGVALGNGSGGGLGRAFVPREVIFPE